MPPPEQQQQPSASERLLRAQAQELEILRDRLKDMPDPDEVIQWRSKAERLDQLQADLPAWRQQLQQAHQQEQQELQARLQQQEADLSRTRTDQELQRLFLESGGAATHWPMWQELAGKNIRRAEDGSLVAMHNGQEVPAADLINAHRTDPLFGVLFHPRLGAGSGAQSGRWRDVHVTNSADLSKVSTSDLFHSAFGQGRRVAK